MPHGVVTPTAPRATTSPTPSRASAASYRARADQAGPTLPVGTGPIGGQNLEYSCASPGTGLFFQEEVSHNPPLEKHNGRESKPW